MVGKRQILIGIGLGLVLIVGALVWVTMPQRSTSGAAVFTRAPYLQNLQQDHVTLCWRTEKPTAAKIHLFRDPGEQVRIWDVPAADEQVFVLDGLSADTSYRYEVRLDGAGATCERGRFRSAPTAGEPIALAVWGDSRTHPDICQRIADGILASGVHMCLHSGDLIASGGHPDQWDYMLFSPARELMRSVVFWPAIGNHELGMGPDGESGRDLYRQQFVLPDPEFYYSFDYGDAHILVLDSNTDACDDPKQYAFAEKDLSSTKLPWKIVMFHHPLFTSGHHGSQIEMRVKYAPLLARHNVDLIVTGHDHNYQLAKPIRHYFEPAQTRPYLHVVSGGGGAPVYEEFDKDDLWFDRGWATNHYVHIGIEGDMLTGHVVGLDGETLDRFKIDHAQVPTEQVYYEQIELERILRSLAPLGLDNRPARGLLLEPEAQQFTLAYRLANPLPAPLIVTLAPPSSEGWTVQTGTPADRAQTIPPKERLDVRYEVQVTDPSKLRLATGMTIGYESPVGSGKVETNLPVVAFRRAFVAPVVDGKIVIDGRGEEPAWQKADPLAGFSQTYRGAPVYPPASPNTTVRLLHDKETVYVLIESKRPIVKVPYMTGTVQGSDHVAIYLGSARADVVFRTDSDGRTHTEPEKVTAIHSAAQRADECVSWEVAIPLATCTTSDSNERGSLRFNLQERRRRDVFSLSPTLGATLDRASSGYLTLE